MKSYNVEIGFQVYLQEGGEEIGAVRDVAPDHVVVYVEGSGDFVVQGPAVVSAHDGKLILDPAMLTQQMREATAHAHDRETE
jgi:hypothetical protein